MLNLVKTFPEDVQQEIKINDRTACEQWNRGIGFVAVPEDKEGARKFVIDFDTNYSSGAFTNPGLAPSSPFSGFTQTSGTGSNNGTGCSPPATTAPQQGGCYRITVPDMFSNVNARVRVTDGTTNASNASSTDFTIKGKIDVINPTAGTVWKVSTSTDINS